MTRTKTIKKFKWVNGERVWEWKTVPVEEKPGKSKGKKAGEEITEEEMKDETGKPMPFKKTGTGTAMTVIDKFFDFLDEASEKRKRTIILHGGARSGKSYSVRQWLLLKSLDYQETDAGLSGLVVMKTKGHTLVWAAWDPMIEMLERLNVPYYKHETLMEIHLGNSRIYFCGMDDFEKVKSTEFNWVWMEEATSCVIGDFLQLKTRLSRASPDVDWTNRIFLTFNPINESNWCIKDVLSKAKTDKTIAELHSNMDDNPFLGAEYKADLEATKEQDENYWRVYRLGLPAHLEGIIYTRYDIVDWIQTPLPVRDRKDKPDSYGLDWGFTHPMSACAYWEYEGEDYILELVHKRRMTTEDLIAEFEKLKVDKGVEMFCPPEQPGMIEQLCSRGYAAKPVPSEYRKVKDGIDYCKGRMLHIVAPSPNYISEIRNYMYKTGKDGKPLEDPVKFQDDAMDAMRYGRVSLRGVFQGFSARIRERPKGDDLTKAMEEVICERRAEGAGIEKFL
jgi:phage terminase large subunit